MPSILDVAPAPVQEVEISRGAKVAVKGLPNDVWASLYQAHPALIAIVQQGLNAVEVSSGDATAVMEKLFALLAVIGAGTALADGASYDSEPHLQAAYQMETDEILTLAGEVIKRSYPAEYLVPLRAALANRSAVQDGRAPASS